MYSCGQHLPDIQVIHLTHLLHCAVDIWMQSFKGKIVKKQNKFKQTVRERETQRETETKRETETERDRDRERQTFDTLMVYCCRQ